MRETTRKTDIVGRFGGEEFLRLLGAAERRLHEVLDAVRAMNVALPGGTLDGITASIGLAAMPLHVARGDALVAAADATLYQARLRGEIVWL